MKRKIIILFLFMFFLLSCQEKLPISVLPVVSQEPVAPLGQRSTPSLTMTPYPTLIQEPTIIAFETLMANVCPTTTPFSMQIESMDALTDGDIQREFSGFYSYSTGFWVYGLIINCDGTFYQQIITDFGPRIFQVGKVTVQNEQMILNGINEDNQLFDGSYTPVRWAQRKYLVQTSQLEVFCETMNYGGVSKEPRDEDSWGLFYLRDGDGNLEAIGYPVLPSGDKVCK